MKGRYLPKEFHMKNIEMNCGNKEVNIQLPEDLFQKVGQMMESSSKWLKVIELNDSLAVDFAKLPLEVQQEYGNRNVEEAVLLQPILESGDFEAYLNAIDDAAKHHPMSDDSRYRDIEDLL